MIVLEALITTSLIIADLILCAMIGHTIRKNQIARKKLNYLIGKNESKKSCRKGEV